MRVCVDLPTLWLLLANRKKKHRNESTNQNPAGVCLKHFSFKSSLQWKFSTSFFYVIGCCENTSHGYQGCLRGHSPMCTHGTAFSSSPHVHMFTHGLEEGQRQTGEIFMGKCSVFTDQLSHTCSALGHLEFFFSVIFLLFFPSKAKPKIKKGTYWHISLGTVCFIIH